MWDSGTVNSGWTWGHYIDGLQFGGGLKIDPFLWPSLNPPATDGTSISTYGVHPFMHEDSQITSFEQAQAEASRLLTNLKNPIPTLTCVKKDYATLLYPSNVVTVGGVDYRIASLVYDWRSSDKSMHTQFNLTPKTSPLPPLWTQENVMRYFVK
jgi:hypothetical protein